MRGLKYTLSRKKYICSLFTGLFGGKGPRGSCLKKGKSFFPSVDMDDFRYDIGFHIYISIDEYMCDNIYFCIGMFVTCVSVRKIYLLFGLDSKFYEARSIYVVWELKTLGYVLIIFISGKL